MAYSDFSLNKLQKRFGLRQTKQKLFALPLRKLSPSQHLEEDIEEAFSYPMASEKAKSELLITPILRELSKKNAHRFTIFSGYSFDVDAKQELNGICDFILGKDPDAVEVRAPIFCLVEIKNNTIDYGFGQCAAEMYAAQLFNQEFGESTEVVYGAVSNGIEWVFMKLVKHEIIIDEDKYFINQLPELLGAFQNIIDFYGV